MFTETQIQRTRWMLAAVLCSLFASICAEKYKLCVVDGKGFKKSGQYCPILDKPDSKVACVIGVDRLDCLRRISKGSADFAVFTPEDLLTAANSQIEVLITNELRYTKDSNEYEIVAVIRDSAGIQNKHDLKDKRFCHPGYSSETEMTKVLANYLEASVIPHSCLTKYTITENRIKASSEFFQSACKAGPWVFNPKLDEELKSKYKNLCASCDSPSRCETSDKYWGRRGSLFCLTDGAGDVAWSRLDDVELHFGIMPGLQESSPEGYSFLCPDGTTKPVNSSDPCVWVVKPWPVVASKRTIAQDVRDFLSTLTYDDIDSWQSAVLNLIENFHLSITKLEPVEPIESFLERATGFLSANSFTGCHPPRTIRICTTSIIANAKCSWLRELAAVYGIEPDLDCLKADNTTHCMQAIGNNAADIVIVPPDLVHLATKKYSLKPLFFETVRDHQKYLTVAVTRNGTSVDKFENLNGLKACFPNYDGVAWNSVVYTLKQKNLLESCPFPEGVARFFGPSCVPGLPGNRPRSLKDKCIGNYEGEFGALRCLLDGSGDVAFLSKNSIPDFVKSPIENKFGKVNMDSFKVLCEDKSEGCHLSWAPLGQAMVRSNSSDLWMKDTLDVFLQIDSLFGRDYKSVTTPLQLFGPFSGQSDVLFHDNTVRFRNTPTARNIDNMKRPYQDIMNKDEECTSSSTMISPFTVYVFSLYLFVLVLQ